jgi:hypothetical protein
MFRADESFKAAAMLADTMSDPKTAFSTSADNSAFARAFNIPFFEFYDTVGQEYMAFLHILIIFCSQQE